MAQRAPDKYKSSCLWRVEGISRLRQAQAAEYGGTPTRKEGRERADDGELKQIVAGILELRPVFDYHSR